MHPKLLENEAFLCYYEKWQNDPASIVFVPISEMLRAHGLIEDAIKVATAGLKHHPELISGRLALARAYLAKGAINSAKGQAEQVLMLMPNNEEAKAILSTGQTSQTSSTGQTGSWNTLTMARILASQGHVEQAKEIYNVILKNEPQNTAAKSELDALLKSLRAAGGGVAIS